MIRTAVFVLTALFATLALPAEVPVQLLHRVQSDTLESALSLAATVMRDHTVATGTEACARVCRRPDQSVVITIVSNGSHLGCMPVQCEEGLDGPETLHSHPAHLARFRPNTADRVFLGLRDNAPSADGVLRNNTRKGFSDADFKVGPGYMVDVNGIVWRQDGRERVVQVLTLPK